MILVDFLDTLNEFSCRFPSTFSKECLRGVTSSCFAVFEGFFFSLLLRTWISAALHFNAQAQQRPWRGAMGATVPVPCVDRPERTPETSVAERGLPAIVLRADARPSPDQPDAEIL